MWRALLLNSQSRELLTSQSAELTYRFPCEAGRQTAPLLTCRLLIGRQVIHGLVDRVLEMVGVKLTAAAETGEYAIRPSSAPTFFPGRQADVFYRKKHIGTFGIIHPEVRAPTWAVPGCNSALLAARLSSVRRSRTEKSMLALRWLVSKHRSCTDSPSVLAPKRALPLLVPFKSATADRWSFTFAGTGTLRHPDPLLSS